MRFIYFQNKLIVQNGENDVKDFWEAGDENFNAWT